MRAVVCHWAAGLKGHSYDYQVGACIVLSSRVPREAVLQRNDPPDRFPGAKWRSPLWLLGGRLARKVRWQTWWLAPRKCRPWSQPHKRALGVLHVVLKVAINIIFKYE
jgi:hypothetical protein